MKHLLAWLTALMLISPSAHAFVIDFNEKWLIDDAYNRAMENAKENMRPSKGRRSGGFFFRGSLIFGRLRPF